jgi:ATP-dependent Clp protease ATP-binding subunit ClpA
LRGLGYDLTVTREAMEFLLREGYDARFGARPMRRAVERHVQDAVVRDLFASGVGSGRLDLAVRRNGLQVVHD